MKSTPRLLNVFFIMVAGLITPVRANAGINDVSNISGQAIVGGTVTIHGNSFSVGGGTFSVSFGRIGIRTQSAKTDLDVSGSAQFGEGVLKSTFPAVPSSGEFAVRLSSGVKISNGGPIEITPGGFLQWADGSISTTALTTFATAFSSQAISGSSSQSSFQTCQTTATIITQNPGARIRITFDGAIKNATAPFKFGKLNVLLDGHFLAGYSSSVGIAGASLIEAGWYYAVPFSVLTDTISIGTHNVCISLAVADADAGAFENDSNSISHLLLEEVR